MVIAFILCLSCQTFLRFNFDSSALEVYGGRLVLQTGRYYSQLRSTKCTVVWWYTIYLIPKLCTNNILAVFVSGTPFLKIFVIYWHKNRHRKCKNDFINNLSIKCMHLDIINIVFKFETNSLIRFWEMSLSSKPFIPKYLFWVVSKWQKPQCICWIKICS